MSRRTQPPQRVKLGKALMPFTTAIVICGMPATPPPPSPHSLQCAMCRGLVADTGRRYQSRGLAYRDKGEQAKAEADFAKAKELGYIPPW